MTVFGVDFHPGFQAGLTMSGLRAAGIEFAMCKVSEGTSWYRDAYHRFSYDAGTEGLLFSAYHFLRSESSGAAQAAWCRRCMGPDWGTVPVMLDWETSVGNTWAGAADAVAFISEARRLGGRIHLNYLPRWYWDRINEPDLATGVLGSLALIQSSYVAGTGPATVLYPGDASAHWNGFGGAKVSILQFSSKCQIPGYPGPLDINAYRGTRAQLAATGWFHDPAPQEADMNLGDTSKIPADLVDSYRNAGSTTVDATTHNTVERLLWLADLRGIQATATAGRAVTIATQARDAITALSAPVIDYGRLAAAVAPLLPPATVDLAAIATAVADEQARRQAE